MSVCAPWATEADLCSPCNDYTIDGALLEDYLLAASEILYELSGQQFSGDCDLTIRPCTARTFNETFPGVTFSTAHRMRIFDRMRFMPWTVCGCSSYDSCGCSTYHKISLGPGPINTVTSVKVDGVELDDSLYRVDDNQFLVRLNDPDGTNPGWPCCQDLSLSDDEEGTFSVTYTYGRDVPAIGRKAAGILACELYMACDPETFEGQCRLPRNIVQIARQGVTVLVSSTAELFVMRPGQPAKFGIWEIDMFLRAFNPYGITTPSIILSPDIPPRGKRVDT